jgi:hypothetical protein
LDRINILDGQCLSIRNERQPSDAHTSVAQLDTLCSWHRFDLGDLLAVSNKLRSVLDNQRRCNDIAVGVRQRVGDTKSLHHSLQFLPFRVIVALLRSVCE